jgi:hypothetical protein
MQIQLKYDSRNYTIIQSLKDDSIYLYSYTKNLAIYDTVNKILKVAKCDKTQTNKKHLKLFKKWLTDNKMYSNI